jgi:hypothetical protein
MIYRNCNRMMQILKNIHVFTIIMLFDFCIEILQVCINNIIIIMSDSITVSKRDIEVPEIKNDFALTQFLKDFPLNHKNFADLYLQDFNHFNAYKTVYKCLDSTALVESSKLLNNLKVQRYLQYRFKMRQQKAEVNVNRLIQDLITIRDDNLNRNANNPKLKDYDRRANQSLAMRAIEMIANMLGITKTVAQNISFNQINNFNQNVIVKTFVVPAFKSTVTPPEISADNTKALIEEYIKERKD